jgi:polyisoprenoid-binding protein YceI
VKKIVNTLTLIFTLFTTLNAQLFTLNPSESSAKWTGYSEVGDYAQSGSINLKSGELRLVNNEVKSATLIFETKSISHSDKKLEKHLKADDFFYVKKFPKALFQLTEIRGKKAYGELTMRGRTNSISFPIEIKKDTKSVTVKGKASINRTLFDIKYNSSSYFQDLGNYAIKNTFDLEFEVHFEKSAI